MFFYVSEIPDFLDLSASDTIEVYKFQDGGSARDVDGDSNRSTFFMGCKLG